MAIPTTGYATATISNPDSALTDFTLLIDLSNMPSSWWSGCNTDIGGYGRACKSDGTTELACDFIDVDHTANTGLLRVKWSGTLASTGTQAIRVYPPNTANTLYSASDTYGSDNAYASHWEAYYPLEDLGDRTTNSLDLTAYNTPTSGSTGQVADDYNFNGSDEYLQDDVAPITSLPMTVLLWAKNADTTPTTENCLFFYGDSSNSGDWLTLEYSSEDIRVWARDTDLQTVSSGTDYADGNFHHIVGTYYNDGSVRVGLYIDGAFVSSDSTSNSTLIANFDRISIARRGDSSPSAYFHGDIDEVQLHSIQLSADWISEEYDQTNDNSTFWGTWTWTSSGSTTHALSGSVESSSSLSGSLILTQTLAGSAESTSSLSAGLVINHDLTGSIESKSSLTGDLTTSSTVSLAGSVESTSALSGSLRITHDLAGSVESSSALSGDLGVSGTQALAGSIESKSALTGSVALTVRLAGTCESSSALTGNLTTNSESTTTYILAEYTTGDTVSVDVYKLLDNSLVANSVSMSEIGSTGIFKYAFSQVVTEKTEYLYIADNGTSTKSGKIVLEDIPTEVWAYERT